MSIPAVREHDGRGAADLAAPRPRERRAAGAHRRRGLRDGTRTVHRWLGLLAGAVLVVSGLTGSALVFRAEIDAALDPHLLRVAPGVDRAPLQAIYDDVVRRFPGDPLPARVRMPAAPGGTLEFWMGSAPDRYVYANPYTGHVLGARAPAEFVTGWIFLLHSHLLSGEAGHVVVGLAALVLIALSLSGIVVWWPRRAPWKVPALWRAALVVRRGAGAKRLNFDLHRALGFYASVLLAIVGTTGASLVFHEQFERAAHFVTGTRPVTAVPPVATAAEWRQGHDLPLDSLLAIAERAQPGGFVSYLYLPTKAGDSFRVRKRLRGEEHPNGKSFVHVDPVTGRVLVVEDGTTAPAGARLYSILYPLHIGILGGTATRVLAVLTGLALPTLVVTGIIIWWRRRRPARARKPGIRDVPAFRGGEPPTA